MPNAQKHVLDMNETSIAALQGHADVRLFLEDIWHQRHLPDSVLVPRKPIFCS